MVISNSRTAPPDTGRRFRIFYQSVIVRVTDVVPLLIFPAKSTERMVVKAQIGARTAPISTFFVIFKG
jgi:hypothetical protein